MSIPDPVVLLDARARYVHPAFQMSRASTKTVFDSTGRLVTVPANAIGWDHDPATGESRGYLAEPSATNLLLHSNDLSESVWTKARTTITPDAITGPDGQGMAKLVETTDTGNHTVTYPNVAVTGGDTVTLAVIAKAGERESIRLSLLEEGNFPNNARCDVSLLDGSITNQVSGESMQFSDGGALYLGDGFWRAWIAGTPDSAITDVRFEVRMIDGNGMTGYTGDGTSGLYLGYCQAEVGSYPTSYIETGASTVTRAGDRLVLPGLGDFPWWRSERGAILVEADAPPLPWHIASQGHFWMFGGSSQFRLSAFPSGACQIRGANFSAVVVSGNVSGVYNKIAVAWDVGDEVAVSRNGGSVNTAAWSGNLDAFRFEIGGNPGASSQQLTFPVSRVIYYPQRISNADLQSLTAIQE